MDNRCKDKINMISFDSGAESLISLTVKSYSNSKAKWREWLTLGLKWKTITQWNRRDRQGVRFIARICQGCSCWTWRHPEWKTCLSGNR